MSRAQITVSLNERLVERARIHGEAEGMKLRHVIELALAEYFAIPPAVPGADMSVALCPRCERGVVHAGRCELCNWHSEPRPWKPRKKSKARTRARLM